MNIKEPVTRICFVDPAINSLEIVFSVLEPVAVGVHFKLFLEGQKHFIEDKKISLDNGGEIIKQVNTDITRLNKSVLTWQVLTCTKNLLNFKGTFNIELKQGKEICKMNESLETVLDNIPPCQINNPASFNGSVVLIFTPKAPAKKI